MTVAPANERGKAIRQSATSNLGARNWFFLSKANQTGTVHYVQAKLFFGHNSSGAYAVRAGAGLERISKQERPSHELWERHERRTENSCR